jgi:aerobic-type carbon monoxide dehydrogenase small subunit (CoxS/CutS family)
MWVPQRHRYTNGGVCPMPDRKAFVDNQAGQCAYCAAGIIMGSYNWLRGRGSSAIPTDDEVKN